MPSMNEHTYKLFKNIFNDVQTKERYIRHNISTLKLYVDTISVEGLKTSFLNVFYHQRM